MRCTWHKLPFPSTSKHGQRGMAIPHSRIPPVLALLHQVYLELIMALCMALSMMLHLVMTPTLPQPYPQLGHDHTP